MKASHSSEAFIFYRGREIYGTGGPLSILPQLYDPRSSFLLQMGVEVSTSQTLVNHLKPHGWHSLHVSFNGFK